MRCEIVVIGTELLLGETTDTNAAFLARNLAALGIDVHYKSTVGDNWFRALEVTAQALNRSDIVITSGGLGPTMDDITRELAAALTNSPLTFSPEAMESIEETFRRRSRPMSQINRKQAYLPQGAVLIPNNHGTAPGYILEKAGKILVSLPGVPRELENMFREEVIPYLVPKTHCLLHSRILHLMGIGESQVEEKVADILAGQSNPTIAPYAGTGTVKLRITAKAENEDTARALIAPIEAELRSRLEPWIYAVDQEQLEELLGRQLSASGQKLAVAESCTGGLITHRLTNVPGSSSYLKEGLVVYSNAAKQDLLGVPPHIFAEHGAVSEACARAMAEGALKRAGTDWALAVTGIAGPGGATPDKPVGLVHMAAAQPGYTKAEVHRLFGERVVIKERAAQIALHLLYGCLRSKTPS